MPKKSKQIAKSNRQWWLVRLCVIFVFSLAGVGLMNRPAMAEDGWSRPSGGVWGVNADSSTVFNNELVVGGLFGTAGSTSVNNIAKWNGTTWSALGQGTNNHVNALAVYNNELYAGGAFTTAGGVTATHIAKWDSTTSTWSPLISGGQNGVGGGEVFALAVFNNELYVGGSFKTAGGVTANNIAKWNNTTSTWSPLISAGRNGVWRMNVGDSGEVRALIVYNNQLYVGGNFQYGGNWESIRLIAKWNNTTSTWSALGEGLDNRQGGGCVNSLTVYNNDLIAGGTIDSSHNWWGHSDGVARWNGMTWSSLGLGLHTSEEAEMLFYDSVVMSLTVYDNNLIAGGSFSQSGDDGQSPPMEDIAKWNNSTSTWEPLGSGTSDDGAVRSLTVYQGLNAAGDFNTIGGIITGHVAHWEESAVESDCGVRLNDGNTILHFGCVANTTTSKLHVNKNGVIYSVLLVPPNDPDASMVRINTSEGIRALKKYVANGAPTLSGVPDKTTDEDVPLDNAIDLWSYATDTETPDSGLTYSIQSTSEALAGVSLDSNRYIDINPAANWSGSSTVVVRATDPGGLYADDTFVVNITAVNDAPAATDDTYTIDEDTNLDIAAPGVLGNDTDVEGGPLTAIKLTDPSSGTFTAFNPDGSFTYVPGNNINGSVSFTYKANDGTADSGAATVTINITAVNDAPVANPDSYTTNAGTDLVVPARGVLSNDTDAETPSGSLTSNRTGATGPSHGTMVAFGTNGSFRYRPTAGYIGDDSFTYRAYDGTDYGNYATVSITVASRPPVLDPIGDKSGTEGKELSFVVTASDPDHPPDTITLSVSNNPDGSSLSATTHVEATGKYQATFTWTPTFVQAGSYPDIVFTATDSHGATDTETITITIAKGWQIEDFGWGEGRPTIIADGNNKLHIIVEKETLGEEVRLSYGTNKTGTWKWFNVGYAGDPNTWDGIYEMALDSNNYAHVLYEYGTDVYYANNTTGSFVPQAFTKFYHLGKSMAIDSNNTIHVIAKENEWNGDGLHYWTKTANGAWQDHGYLGGTPWMPAIAIGPDDVPQLVVQHWDDGTWFGNWNGTSWNMQKVQIYPGWSNTGEQYPTYKMAIDQNNKAHVIATQGYSYTNESGSFDMDGGYPNYYNWNNLQDNAIDSDNNLHLFASDDGKFEYDTNASGNWVMEYVDDVELVSGLITDLSRMDGDVDGDGGVHVLYTAEDTFGNGMYKYAYKSP